MSELSPRGPRPTPFQRRSRRCLLAIPIVALTVLGAGRLSAAEVATRGTVLAPDGSPLADARVALVPVQRHFDLGLARLEDVPDPDPAATTTSGPDGRFLLTHVEPGVYAVEVRVPGRLAMRHLPRVVGVAAELPPVQLSTARHVTVRVVDAHGVPQSGVTILTETAGTSGEALPPWLPVLRRATTGAAGEAEIEIAAGEVVDLTLFAPGSAPSRHPAVSLARDAADLRLTLGAAGLRHRLRVVGADGEPLAGVVVRQDRTAWPVGVTGGDGLLDLHAAAGEPVDLRLATRDGRAVHLELPPVANAVARSPTPSPTSGHEQDRALGTVHDIALPNAQDLRGRVLDADGGPLAGAVVWPLADPGAFAVTDGAGRWSLSLPADESHQVQVEAAGHLPTRLPLSSTFLASGRAPTLRLPRPVALVGRVTDPAGEPLPGASLAAVPRGRRGHFGVDPADDRTASGADGSFALDRLRPARAYDVVAAAPGRATVRVAAMAPPAEGAPPRLHLVLPSRVAAHGRVVATDERPVEGARVELSPHGAGVEAMPPSVVEATTDHEGFFRVAALPAGEIDARVTADGFARLAVLRIETQPRSDANLEAGAAGAGLDLGTFVLAVGGVIQGTVADPQGRPIAAAEVHVLTEETGLRLRRSHGQAQILDARPAEATTGEDGRFQVQDLPPGTRQTLFATAAGHLPARVDGVVVGGEPVVFTLSAAARVAGQVVDEEGAPVPGASVHLSWRDTLPGAPERRLPTGSRFTTTSDEDGRFEFDTLRPGVAAQVAVSVERRVDPPPQEVTPSLDEVARLLFIAERGAALHGFVLDTEGEPVEGAHVVATGAGTVSDAEGAYRVEGVRPGEGVRTRLRHPVHGRWEEHLDLVAGDNRHDWEVPGAAAVSGHVVAHLDGAPVAGAEVELVAATPEAIPSFRAISDGVGHFVLPRVPPGAYTLQGRAAGFAAGEAGGTVEVGDDHVTDLSLALDPAARIHGRVVGLPFEEIARVRVSARRLGVERSAHVGHRGDFRLDDLGYGTWQVEASLDVDRRQVARRVVLDRDRTQAEVELEFGNGLTLDGLVLLDHEPLSGARISLRGESTTVERSLTSDHLGEFAAHDLPVGAYHLSIGHPRHAAVHNDLLHLEADHRVVVDLEIASLRGRVTASDDGSPLPGARVALTRDGAGQGVVIHVTDEAGDFHVAEIAAGTYDLRVQLDGYVAVDRRLEVPPGTGTTSLEISLDSVDGLPLEIRLADGRTPTGVLALARSPRGGVVASDYQPVAADGTVRIGVPAGSWQLLLSAPGGGIVEVPVTVPTAGPLPVVLPAGGRMTVRVPELAASLEVGSVRLLGSDGAPHRLLDLGLRSTVDRWPLSGATAQVTGVPAGVWTVIANAEGRTWEATFVTSGEDAEVVLGGVDGERPSRR